MSPRKHQGSILSGFSQPPLLSSQTEQVMSNLRPQLSKQVPEGPDLQDGNCTVYKAVSVNRGMGLLPRIQGCPLSHAHKPNISKIPKVSLSKSDLPVHSSTL